MPRPASRALARLLSVAGLSFALAAPLTAQETVYDNSTTDTFLTYFYGDLETTRLGDVVQLGGTNRLLSDASVQFFNGSSVTGSFRAQLQLFAFDVAEGTVGPLLHTATSGEVSIGDGDDAIRTVHFTGLNVLVPDVLAFMVGIFDATAGLDLGLNVFEPPTIGSSDNARLLLDDDEGDPVVGVTTPGEGNLFFVANARALPVVVPEPANVVLLGTGVLMLAYVAHRRRATSV